MPAETVRSCSQHSAQREIFQQRRSAWHEKRMERMRMGSQSAAWVLGAAVFSVRGRALAVVAQKRRGVPGVGALARGEAAVQEHQVRVVLRGGPQAVEALCGPRTRQGRHHRCGAAVRSVQSRRPCNFQWGHAELPLPRVPSPGPIVGRAFRLPQRCRQRCNQPQGHAAAAAEAAMAGG